ncbi:MAG: hypothetical protein JWP89_1966 [Schlesneria sp.]|nr:hypothetical protein [Schlesneria sp.]
MTRFKLRAVFALGGLIVGVAIWASVGASQENTPPPAADLPLPSGTGPAAISPATVAPSAAEAVPTVQRALPASTTSESDAGGALALPLRAGETATERDRRLSAEAIRPSVSNGPGFGFSSAGLGADVGGTAPPQPAEVAALRVFSLKRMNASSLKEIVETLVPTARGQIAIDGTTNSLIMRVPDSVFAEIQQLVNDLDSMEVNSGGSATQNGSRAKRPGGEAQQLGVRMGGKGNEMMNRMIGSAGVAAGSQSKSHPSLPMSSAELRKRYETTDRAAREMAQTIKADPSNVPHKQELRRLVSEVFSLRQGMLRSELADFQSRMSTIQESINLRDRVAEQIIERRVSELLDPNLQWEPASVPGIGASGSVDANGVQWRRPLGLPGGMGPGREGTEGWSSNGKASFTSEAVPIVPSNSGIFSGFGRQ